MVLQFSRSRTQSRLTWRRFGFLGFEVQIELIQRCQRSCAAWLSTDPSGLFSRAWWTSYLSASSFVVFLGGTIGFVISGVVGAARRAGS